MVIAMSRSAMELQAETTPIRDIESFILQRAEFKRLLAMMERDDWSVELRDYMSETPDCVDARQS
jgi:hypothetical protein